MGNTGPLPSEVGLELTQTREPRIITFLGLLPASCTLKMLVYSVLMEVLHTLL